ncbi:MAG: T9SS type A sorting domain-containing protein, partial [Bacteroidales bacterium]|nr:T9SS type A sorting domain-containing protein [Bacteroidales bacterium]
IPEAGVLTLRIMGMNGQVLYREEVDAEAGSGNIRVNLSDLAAGVYYYSVEYRGERVVKKMNVVREYICRDGACTVSTSIIKTGVPDGTTVFFFNFS